MCYNAEGNFVTFISLLLVRSLTEFAAFLLTTAAFMAAYEASNSVYSTKSKPVVNMESKADEA